MPFPLWGAIVWLVKVAFGTPPHLNARALRARWLLWNLLGSLWNLQDILWNLPGPLWNLFGNLWSLVVFVEPLEVFVELLGALWNLQGVLCDLQGFCATSWGLMEPPEAGGCVEPFVSWFEFLGMP